MGKYNKYVEWGEKEHTADLSLFLENQRMHYFMNV